MVNIPARPLALLAGLALLAAASLVLALHAGIVPVDWHQLWATLTGDGHGLAREVVLELRLPRAGAAFAAGALLAVAGALMQVLVRNPLADPYILGVSGGAATGALGAMLLGLGGSWPAAGAFGGALLSTAGVFGLARRQGNWSPTRLLLTGVVVAAGWGAAVSFMLAVSPSQGLRGMLFWLMGDLSAAGDPRPALVVLAVGLAIATAIARQLNVLAHGELPAAALGVAVERMRITVYLLASLLTAVAVTLAGSIGFVGLVVPHILRLLGLRDHRVLLPGAALLGGALLTAADTLARTAFAPRQLPVGVLTALLGVPLFLYLLGRSRVTVR
jgi:iron complex transport system permease protein